MRNFLKNQNIKLAIILIIALFFSCKTVKDGTGNKLSKNQKGDKILSDKDKVEFQYSFAEGVRNKMLGNYQEAVAFFTRCLQIDKSSAVTMFELASIFAANQDYDGALDLAQKAVNANPQNMYYQLLLAELLIQNKQVDKAIDVYRVLSKNFPDKIESQYKLAYLLSSSGKQMEALKIYNQIEQQIGLSDQISLAKNEIYQLQGDTASEAKELNKLIAAYPDETRFMGMLAEFYTAHNKPEQALEIYNKILKIDPNNNLIRLSLASYYKKNNQNDKAFNELNNVFADSTFDINMKVRAFVSTFANQDGDVKKNHYVDTLIETLTKAHPTNSSAYLLAADYYLQSDQKESARNNLRLALRYDKSNYQVWEQLLMIEAQISDYRALFKESNDAIDYFPNIPNLYLYNGIAAYEITSYTKGIESLKAGVDLVIDDKNLKGQFYVYLGESYQKVKNYKESGTYFDLALQLDPENKYVLNNYAYYLSLRGDSLAKAEQLGKKVITLEPENGTYLDTYAWVLYKMKKFSEAKINQEKAIKNGGGGNPVIVEHYGDILYKLGEIENAKQMWNKAKKLGKGSEFLEEKINSGTLIE